MIYFGERKPLSIKKSSNEEIVTFVDKYITCHKSDSWSEMEEFVNLQMHRHAET